MSFYPLDVNRPARSIRTPAGAQSTPVLESGRFDRSYRLCYFYFCEVPLNCEIRDRKGGIMKCRLLLIITAFMVIGGIAGADETEKPWNGSGEVGFLMTTGNSETRSVNAKTGLQYEHGHVLSTINLAAVYSSVKTEIDGKKEDRTSAEKYNASGKAGYKFSELDYVFLNAAYEDDRFSGYDYRSDYAAGYGRKIFNTDRLKLNLEAGPGYRYDKRDDGRTESEAVFRGYVLFDYRFSDQAGFRQEVTILAGLDNTGTTSVTALKSQIVDALSMKVSYTIDHNTHVPEDKKHTDSETALTLVYDF